MFAHTKFLNRIFTDEKFTRNCVRFEFGLRDINPGWCLKWDRGKLAGAHLCLITQVLPLSLCRGVIRASGSERKSG